MSLKTLLQSYSNFRENEDKKPKDKLNNLANEGQDPNVLFITCIDSRLDPTMFFENSLGDMFVVRNPGNFVLPFSKTYSGIGASIEFALAFFDIKDIIICGHSQCGACEAISKKIDVGENKQLAQWLEQNKIIGKRHFFTENPQEQFEKESLLQQSKNIKTYPIVKKALKKGTHLHSWYIDMKTSLVYKYDGHKFIEL